MVALYQLMPDLSEEEYQGLKADIAERGIMVPVEIDENGNVLDGHHRLRAWKELTEAGLELPPYPRQIRAGWTEQQKRNYIRALNILRRHLTKAQRKEQWEAMRKDGMSYRQIAEASGVGEATVRRSSASNDAVQPETVVGKDGKKRKPRKKQKSKPPQAPTASIYADSDQTEEKAKAKAQKVIKTGNEGASQSVHITMFSHESKEYYTPPQYVEAARKVLGEIDLDPASCDMAQSWINAKHYFTVTDDGYSQEWFGRVWLNPPYSKEEGQSNQERWSRKLIEEYKAGRVKAAVLLIKAALGYNWFEDLWINWPTCCARERISFITPNGEEEGQSKMASAFLYLGPETERFRAVFRQFGRIIMPEKSDETL